MVVKGRGFVVAGLMSLVLFIMNTVLVLSGATQSPDASLALWINNAYLGGTVTELMVLASRFGRELFWLLVLGVMVLFGTRETRLLGVELAVLFGIGIV